MIVRGLVLIEGNSLNQDDFKMSLANAMQIVLGSTPDFGVILHLAANSLKDFENALLKFAKVKDVTGVLTLALRQ